jgi:hypothetical protein
MQLMQRNASAWRRPLPHDVPGLDAALDCDVAQTCQLVAPTYSTPLAIGTEPLSWNAGGGEPPAAWFVSAVGPRLRGLLAALQREVRQQHKRTATTIARAHARLLAVSCTGGRGPWRRSQPVGVRWLGSTVAQSAAP